MHRQDADVGCVSPEHYVLLSTQHSVLSTCFYENAKFKDLTPKTS